jgi:hypothetical protein
MLFVIISFLKWGALAGFAAITGLELLAVLWCNITKLQRRRAGTAPIMLLGRCEYLCWFYLPHKPAEGSDGHNNKKYSIMANPVKTGDAKPWIYGRSIR